MASGLWSRYKRHMREKLKRQNNPAKLKAFLKNNNQSKKRYQQKHREEILIKMRERSREMRQIALEIGNCSACFNARDNPKFKTCSKCRAYFRKYYAEKRK